MVRKNGMHAAKHLLFGLVALLILVTAAFFLRGEEASEHVYSHRGASGEETEHTFAAYDLAVMYGSRYIEQDVVQSQDGTLYVSHDLSAKRMTGVDRLFEDMTDSEIDKLSVGDGRILKLSEVFDRYGNNKDLIFVVELKDYDAVSAFSSLVHQYGNSRNIIVQCADLSVLESMKNRYPEMRTLYLASNQREFDDAVSLSYIDIMSVNKELMIPENITIAHENKKLFNVWTLDTTEEIKEAIALGVDSYFTNYTAKALTLEEKYRD